MLWQRVLTALILMPLVLGLLFILPLQGYILVVSLLLLGCGWEWARLAGWQRPSHRLGFVLVLALAMGLTLLQSPAPVLWRFPPLFGIWSHSLPSGWLLLGIGAWLAALGLVLGFPASARLWQGRPWLAAGLGLMWLMAAWTAFILVRSIQYSPNFFQGSFLLLGLLLLIWTADIGAYFVGRSLGKHKLAPKVSPGKSIEGVLGALACSLLLIPLAYRLDWFAPVPLYQLLLAIPLLVLISVLGDLTESLFKRVQGLKDSGQLLPGHGGLYDRLDSLIAGLPFYVLVLAWLES